MLWEDALRAVPLVERFAGPLVDVGSGGGSPGIPLAAALPEREVTLLEALADEIADRVRESGAAEELEPMTSVERKIVHLRLKDAAGVATTSEGTEPNRYVVVLPG